jgi:hypothetical protein
MIFFRTVTRNVSKQFVIIIIIYVIFQAQNFLVVTIAVAILIFIVGAFVGPLTTLEEARGFVGFDCKYGIYCP